MRIQKGLKFSGKHTSHTGSGEYFEIFYPQNGLGRVGISLIGTSIASYSARLRTLFWIAVSNFVFPVIFDISQIVLIFQDNDFIKAAAVVNVNTYISILGVLFSTIWATGSHRVGESTISESRPPTNSYSVRMTRLGSALAPPTHSLGDPERSTTGGSTTDSAASLVKERYGSYE